MLKPERVDYKLQLGRAVDLQDISFTDSRGLTEIDSDQWSLRQFDFRLTPLLGKPAIKRTSRQEHARHCRWRYVFVRFIYSLARLSGRNSLECALP